MCYDVVVSCKEYNLAVAEALIYLGVNAIRMLGYSVNTTGLEHCNSSGNLLAGW